MGDVSRREFLRRTGIGAGSIASVGGLSGLIAACGGSNSSSGGGGSASSGGGKVIKPKIGLSSTPQASYLPVIAGPIMVGSKFGLPAMTEKDFTIFDSSTTLTQSALSGQVNIGGQSTMAQLLLVDKGLPFKIFATYSLSDDFVIASRGNVTSLAQLKDPKVVVATDSPGGAGQAVFDAMLGAHNAGFMVTDIPKTAIVESSTERASALDSGDCDATVIHQIQANQIQKKHGDVHILAKLYGAVPNFMKEVYAARTDWLEKNMETAAAVTASVIQSSRDLLSSFSSLQSGCKKLLEEPPPTSDLKQLYTIMKDNPIYPTDGGLTDARLDFMINLGKKEGLIKGNLTPEKVVDRRPMQRAMELLKNS